MILTPLSKNNVIDICGLVALLASDSSMLF